MNITTAFMLLSASGGGSMIKLLIFFVFLMLVFWGINMSKHLKGNKRSRAVIIVDVIGLIFFGGLLLMLIIPLLRGA